MNESTEKTIKADAALARSSRSSGAQAIRGLLVTREVGVLVALLALCVFFSFASHVFLTSTNILNLLRQISLLGVLAVGATYVLIISEVDLSVGSLYGFAGMVSGLLIVNNVPEIAAIVITLFFGLAIGALNGAITVAGRIPSFITTLGTLYLIRGATLVMSSGMPVSLPHGQGAAPIITYLAQGSLFGGLSNQVLVLIAIAAAGYFLLHKTTFGFHIFAIGGNDRAARIVGVPVVRTKIIAFALAGVLAAFAGVINFGFLENVQPVTGMGLELDVIAAVIIGGTSLFGGYGSIVGSVVGAIFIGILGFGLLVMGLSTSIQEVIKGAIIILAVSVNRR